MRNISAILLRLCGSLALITQAEAEVSFSYDAPGNLTVQSNVVTVALPQFQQVVPQFVGVASNGLAAISVPVVGVGPLTFQWLLNTAPVSAATNDTYVIANATTANLGNYQLVAANSAGSATSLVVNVSFLDPNGGGLPLAWEMYYFGTNGLIGFSDPDKSGATLYEDYTENINPTNAGSAYAINPGSPSWINPNGGNWSLGTNWSTGSVPAPYSSPVITLAGTYTVTVDVPVTAANLTVGASATLHVPAGQTVTVSGNAVFNGQASLNLGNTTLTVGGQLSLANGANIFSNGTLAGTITWTGGSLSGSLTMASNSVLNIAVGGVNGFNSLILTNYGTVNWANTQLYGISGNNAQIYNYGLWNAQSDNTFVGANGTGSSLFDNFGTFLKSGNTGTTTLDANVVFNNTGTVTVQNGTLAIHGGGTGTSSTFATTGSGNISIYGYVYANTTTFTGLGNYVAGGTATFGGAVLGTLNWNGGSLNGVMTLASNSVFNINFAGGNGFFPGLVLTNYGIVNWTNTQLYGRNSQNAQIYNYGLWNAQSDNPFTGGNDGGTSLFDNFGTFLKSGNTGPTTLDSGVVFNNTGTVTVQGGTLNIDSGSNNGGNFATTNSAILNLFSYVFTNTTTFTGSSNYVAGGTAAFGGAIVGTLNWVGGNLSGIMTLASNSVFNINFGGGNGFFSGLVITNYGTVNWTNTQLFGINGLNAQIYNYGLWNAQSDDAFTGGNNGGTSLFDNFGTFLKSGNAGTTILDSGVVFNNTGIVSVRSGTFRINGGGVNSGSGTFITANGGLLVLNNLTFANSVTISGSTVVALGGNTTVNGVLTAANLQLVGGTFVGTNVLVGTLTWSGGTLAGSLTVASNSVLNIVAGGGNGFYGLVLTNYGTVNWTNTQLYGRIGQNAQIYNYGLWNAQSDDGFTGGNDGGTSLFDNFGTFLKSGNTGTTTLDANVVFNNTGTVTVQSGTLAIRGGGIGTGSTFATTGSGNISIYGYVYANATTFIGLGNYVAGGTATFGGAVLGTLNWNGGSLSGVMTLASNSVLNIVAGGGYGFYGLVLTNYGMVNWTNTHLYGRNLQNAQIYNYGLWNAQSDDGFTGGNDGGTSLFDNFGTFLKSGNTGTTTLDANVVFNNTGTVTVQSGTLAIRGGGIGTGSTFATTGSGNISIYGYVYANATTFIGLGNYVAGGTATFSGAVLGTLNWDGGSLSGVMTVASNSVLNIVAGGGNGFYGLVLTNYGMVNWTNTHLYGRNSQNAQIYNYGLWDAQSDDGFTGGNDGGTSLFDNFGTFLKSGNTGTTTLDSGVAFTNRGTVSVQRGTLALNGPYNLAFGTLNVGLNNLTNYGAISLAGAAPLSGSVSANLNNGFIPANGNTFTILSYGSESGGFSSTLLPLGFLWTTNYGSAAYTISVASTLPAGSISNLVVNVQSSQIRLQFYGETNASYTVLGTTNLTVPASSWIPLGQPVLQSGVIFQYLDSQSPVYPQRFYMIRSP